MVQFSKFQTGLQGLALHQQYVYATQMYFRKALPRSELKFQKGMEVRVLRGNNQGQLGTVEEDKKSMKQNYSRKNRVGVKLEDGKKVGVQPADLVRADLSIGPSSKFRKALPRSELHPVVFQNGMKVLVVRGNNQEKRGTVEMDEKTMKHTFNHQNKVGVKLDNGKKVRVQPADLVRDDLSIGIELADLSVGKQEMTKEVREFLYGNDDSPQELIYKYKEVSRQLISATQDTHQPQGTRNTWQNHGKIMVQVHKDGEYKFKQISIDEKFKIPRKEIQNQNQDQGQGIDNDIDANEIKLAVDEAIEAIRLRYFSQTKINKETFRKICFLCIPDLSPVHFNAKFMDDTGFKQSTEYVNVICEHESELHLTFAIKLGRPVQDSHNRDAYEWHLLIGQYDRPLMSTSGENKRTIMDGDFHSDAKFTYHTIFLNEENKSKSIEDLVKDQLNDSQNQTST